MDNKRNACVILANMLLFLTLIFPAFAQENYNDDWEYSRNIYFNTTATGADVSKDITEFPVLIRLNRSNFKFKEANKRGEDIRFSDYQGNNLSYEIECWQRNMQKAEIWVKAPLIHGNSSSNYITIHWGNQEAKDSSSHKAVFERENGFVLVLHLNRYCKYRYNKPNYRGQYKKYNYNRFSPFKHGIMENESIEDESSENIEEDKEVNVIIKDIEKGNRISQEYLNRAIFQCKRKYYNYMHYNYMPCIKHDFTISWWALSHYNRWTYFAYVFKNGERLFYKNGVKEEHVYKAFMPGKIIKEFRICNVARSAEWIKLCYENQSIDQTLIQFQHYLVDSDNDGVPNIVENAVGTDPRNKYDTPVLAIPSQWENTPWIDQEIIYDFSSYKAYSKRDSIVITIPEGSILSDYVPIVRIKHHNLDTTVPALEIPEYYGLIGDVIDVTGEIADGYVIMFGFPFANSVPDRISVSDLKLQCHDGYSWQDIPISYITEDAIYAEVYTFSGFVDYISPVIYVDASKTEVQNPDGSSWDNAFANLQDALGIAAPGDNLWIAKGRYIPGTDKSDIFFMKSDVFLYGGFKGKETGFHQRDWKMNESNLSGDINGDDAVDDEGNMINRQDNANRVTEGCDNFVLDGVTISGGYGLKKSTKGLSTLSVDEKDFENYSEREKAVIRSHNYIDPVYIPGFIEKGERSETRDISETGMGPGMYCQEISNVNIRNCTFKNNYTATFGAGIFMEQVSDFKILNCVFKDNLANSAGGAIYNCNNSNPEIKGCTFINNSRGGGGAIHNNGMHYIQKPFITECAFIGNIGHAGGAILEQLSSSSSIINCIFIENSASVHCGGAILIQLESEPEIVNCTFTLNTAGYKGGAIHNDFNSNPVIKNCILWDNSAGKGNEISNARKSHATISYCDIMGGIEGIVNDEGSSVNDEGGNINEDPKFFRRRDFEGSDGVYMTPDDGLMLHPALSPCINAGTSLNAPSIDILGIERPKDDEFDIGAYENFTCLVYVDKNSPSPGNGVTWQRALTNLQAGLEKASEKLDYFEQAIIWVADGKYRPSKRTREDDPRTATFQMIPGVKIYGGFRGAEDDFPGEIYLEDREFWEYRSILSGNIGFPMTNRDNCYHVVINADKSGIDGFEITDGYNDLEAYPDNCGGGILSGDGIDANISNCLIKGNYVSGVGAGILLHGTYGNGLINNCVFENNRASSGSGIEIEYSNADIKNCVFINNNSINYGGGSFIALSSTIFTNCIFYDNSAGSGGAMCNGKADVYLKNCTFTYNNAVNYGGAIYSIDNAYTRIINTILWADEAPNGKEIFILGEGNVYCSYSCIEGGYGGIGNIGEDPQAHNPRFMKMSDPKGDDGLFATEDDGLRLHKTSPCIDVGINEYSPEFDMIGIERPQDYKVDMGAYEFCPSISQSKYIGKIRNGKFQPIENIIVLKNISRPNHIRIASYSSFSRVFRVGIEKHRQTNKRKFSAYFIGLDSNFTPLPGSKETEIYFYKVGAEGGNYIFQTMTNNIEKPGCKGKPIVFTSNPDFQTIGPNDNPYAYVILGTNGGNFHFRVPKSQFK